MAKTPKKVSERLTKEIRSFQRVLKRAKDRDVNESDTVTIIGDILSNVFGFDKYAEVTSEQSIRGTYCDLAVKLDGSIKYLIEVKAIGMTLKENHLRQAVNYGANQGIPWVVLTNGIDWEIYKIKSIALLVTNWCVPSISSNSIRESKRTMIKFSYYAKKVLPLLLLRNFIPMFKV